MKFETEFFHFSTPDWSISHEMVSLNVIKVRDTIKSGYVVCRIITRFRNGIEQAEFVELLKRAGMENRIKEKGKFVHWYGHRSLYQKGDN